MVVGFGATTLVLLATTIFYLKSSDRAGSAGNNAASSGSVLEKAEELDREVSSEAAKMQFIVANVYEIIMRTFIHNIICSLSYLCSPLPWFSHL